MSENDIQQIARFTREFVLTSLIPWMEKCVVEWNDAYSSSKRLPSRLFSSTRRLFGSGASTPPPPVHTPSTSTSSLPIRSLASNTSQTSFPGSGTLLQPPSHLRRLAEFATILGDYKLATSVWESLRKEGKGGSVSWVDSCLGAHCDAYILNLFRISFRYCFLHHLQCGRMQCRRSRAYILLPSSSPLRLNFKRSSMQSGGKLVSNPTIFSAMSSRVNVGLCGQQEMWASSDLIPIKNDID